MLQAPISFWNIHTFSHTLRVCVANLVPKMTLHIELANELMVSGIAKPSHGKTHTTIAAMPARIIKVPNIFSDGACIMEAPMRNEEMGTNMKKANETYRCKFPYSSVNMPIPHKLIAPKTRIEAPM